MSLCPPPLPPALCQGQASVKGKELLIFHLRTVSAQKNGRNDTPKLLVQRLVLNHPAFKSILDNNAVQTSECAVSLLSACSPVSAIIQNGPSCGLVALAMAGQLVSGSALNVDKLMSLAVECGFTRHGEMFSAENLLSLARLAMPSCSGCVLSPNVSRETKIRLILESVARQEAVLVPYDRDANSEPTRKRGHYAHWALINGFVLAIDYAKLPQQQRSLCDADETVPQLLHTRPGNAWSAELLEKLKVGEIMVYAMHGRGTESSLWSLASLLDSNDQLVEVDPNKDETDFLIPEAGVEKGLCGMVILLNRHC